MGKIAGFWKSLKIQIAGFWKSLKIQIVGFWKVFKFQLNITPKILSAKYLVNNRHRRHCKMHIIVFPKTKLKRIKLIKTVFLKT